MVGKTKWAIADSLWVPKIASLELSAVSAIANVGFPRFPHTSVHLLQIYHMRNVVTFERPNCA